MTKGDLLDLLAPFSDEIEILGRNGAGQHFDLGNGLYGIRNDGDGCISLEIGSRATDPKFGHRFAHQLRE